MRIPATQDGRPLVSLRQVLEGLGKALHVPNGTVHAKFKAGRLVELHVDQQPTLAELDRSTLVWSGPIESDSEGGSVS